jgi:hypothetical protein
VVILEFDGSSVGRVAVAQLRCPVERRGEIEATLGG